MALSNERQKIDAGMRHDERASAGCPRPHRHEKPNLGGCHMIEFINAWHAYFSTCQMSIIQHVALSIFQMPRPNRQTARCCSLQSCQMNGYMSHTVTLGDEFLLLIVQII